MRRRPKGFWPAEAIRQALSALHGEADMHPDIYGWIQSHIDLTPQELAASPHQGRPKYVHTVRGIADDMVKAKKLIRVKDGRFRLP